MLGSGLKRWGNWRGSKKFQEFEHDSVIGTIGSAVSKTMNATPSTSEIIALAWADDVSFDKIKRDTGLSERDVIKVMRGNLKPRSFELWRARVSGRKAKHERKARLIEREDDLG
jgi:uncharacterized protein (TIGR03643 family)